MADWRGKSTFERDLGDIAYHRRNRFFETAHYHPNGSKKIGKNPNNTSLVDALNRIGGEEGEKGCISSRSGRL